MSDTTNKAIRFGLSLTDLVYLALASGWFLALLMFLGQAVASHQFFSTVSKNPYFFLDYVKYYVFTALTFGADSLLLYDPSTQWSWTERLLYPAHLHQLMFSEYPPFTGLLLAPLKLVRIDWGYLLWLAVLLGSSFALTARLARVTVRSSAITIAAILLATFSSVPGEWATLLGQLNWVMLGMISLLALGLLRKNDALSAVALVVMSLKPQYAVFFTAATAGARRIRALVYFAVAEVALLAVAALRIGINNVLGYPAIVYGAVVTGRVGGITIPSFASDPQFSVSIRRLLDLVLPPQASAVSGALIYGAGLISVIVLWWKLTQSVPDEKRFRWAVAISVLTFLVVNPHCHVHDCVCLAAAAAVTLRQAGLAQLSTRAMHGIAPTPEGMPVNPVAQDAMHGIAPTPEDMPVVNPVAQDAMHGIAPTPEDMSVVNPVAQDAMHGIAPTTEGMPVNPVAQDAMHGIAPAWNVLLYIYAPLSWIVFMGLPATSLMRTIYFLGMNIALLCLAAVEFRRGTNGA